MPNWTTNTLHMKGIGKKKELFTNNHFDFNKIIPEPRTEEECINTYGEKYIYNNDGTIQVDEDKKWFNWYNWHIDFWGTKRNSSGVTKIVDDDTIIFDTAWKEPFPIFLALSRMFPNKIIEVTSDFEGGFGTLYLSFENGNCTKKIHKEEELQGE